MPVQIADDLRWEVFIAFAKKDWSKGYTFLTGLEKKTLHNTLALVSS